MHATKETAALALGSMLVALVLTTAFDLQGQCGTGDGSWSDCRSSMQVSPGWTASLYEQEGFAGNSLDVTSSI
jgi:hypothetical protein